MSRSRQPRSRRSESRRQRRGWRRWCWWLWVPLAYLLGSVPFSYLAVRWLTGLDVRRFGSGNPGATNALRVGGPKAGVAALLGDAGKGALATAVPRALGAPPWVGAASAVAVTAGHVFPAFLRLRGGKGTATGFGSLVSLAPGAALGSLGIFSVTVATTRYVSLGSVVAAGGFPLLVAAGRARKPGSGFEVLAAAGAVTALIVTRHRGNLLRLRTGSERRLGHEGFDRPSGLDPEAAGRPESPSDIDLENEDMEEAPN